MMRALLLVALAVSGVAAQNPVVSTYSGVKTTTLWSPGCKSQFGSGGKAPRPLPTVTTSDLVLHTTTTEPPTTKPSIVTVTAPASTSTMRTSTSLFIYVATFTADTKTVKRDGPTTTFATATFSTTECTDGVAAPQTTVTVYSGVYTPVPGQATASPVSYPTQVVCQSTQDRRRDHHHRVSPVVTVSKVTATVTSTTTWATQTTWRTTVTEISTTLAAAATTETVRTSCAPTVTKTYAAKCAPTNLVKDHDGRGLLWNGVDGNATYAVTHLYETDGDGAACCQACVDNDGCSAVEVTTGNLCRLYFNHDAGYRPVCGSVGLTYRSFPNIWPGQGIWVQGGCGEARWLDQGQ
ncbi:hypothetical protein PG985_010511 [Apiospora marii]|uniref:uncharacterized protein n=1 Tax=Apiospora marii TaxID=335849 RepID=UPI0031325AD5